MASRLEIVSVDPSSSREHNGCHSTIRSSSPPISETVPVGGDETEHKEDKDETAPCDGESPPESQPSTEEVPQAPSSSTGWFSWLSGAAAAASTQNQAVSESDQKQAETTQPPPDCGQEAQSATEPQSTPEVPASTQPTTSWFSFWFSTAPSTSAADEVQEDATEANKTEGPQAEQSEDVIMQDTPSTTAPTPMASQLSGGSTWAFWSRDTTSRKTGETSTSEQGELAVIGDQSETSPNKSNVQVDDESKHSAKSKAKDPRAQGEEGVPVKKSKRGRPRSLDTGDLDTSRPSTPDANLKNVPQKSTVASTAKTPVTNLLLPSFKSTYRMKENPSIIKQIAQLLLRTQQPATKHVFLSKEPPKVKKAIAIGVHGLFPASYLRPMIGQPTGTSIRFANHCAEAIRRWTDSHGSPDCEIEKIALEGEGKIAERVDNLWKLLLNWIEPIKNADLIVLACHSQGVPVSIMLLAKLVDMGILTTSRVGVCAMAGVSLGPFPDYKSGMGMLMGSAAELWQFANPESELSKRYENALKTVVDYGARITYVGSIDDQLVPMESAIYGPVSHPYIYRAVFIDGRIHAPDFLAHLVGFALKLRNLGVSDHGLIRELSVPLAGSLYSGEGHSRLYDDEQVYDLALSHTLETTSVSKVPCQIQKHQGLANPNPYVLPWIMRGLLEEEFVKSELYSETVELLKQFDNWAPTTKALKDVKYRLEAVRSKL
ncbi:hypothetical protein F5Y17DRAFT_132562 [Xylariaceae sp. FL0594]|nr:hypothetical protein F5Y17DRAFT_132562 [Xylariaceae sp. FL0594]